MTTNADQSDEYQQGAAEERRKAFNEAMQQAEESQLLDNALSVKVEATRKAADEVKTKIRAAQTAEQGAKAAAVERQHCEVELDSKTKAAELKATEVTDALAAQQNAEIERKQKESAATGSTDPGLQEALKLADETLKAAQDVVANAEKASKEAARQKEDAERKLAAARTAEAEARKKASEARETEAAALAIWEKTQGELQFLRSRLCKPLRFRDKVTPEMAIKFGFIVVGALGLWFLYKLASKDFLDLIQTIDIARGLITFLVAISAVTLAIILSLYPIAASDDATPLKERFGLSKEIFMVFVGILGTIVGFYFASDRGGNGRAEPPPPFLSLDLSEAHPGDKVKFTSLMYTGKPPFNWAISSEPKGIAASGSDPDGYIEAQVPIPAELSGEYTIKLTVTDSAGSTVAEPQGKLKVIGESSLPALPTGPTDEFVLLVPDEVKAGDSFTLESTVPAGMGTPVFDYTISLDLPVIMTITGKTQQDDGRTIKQVVKIPPGTLAGDYTIKLQVTDSDKKPLPDRTQKLKIIAE